MKIFCWWYQTRLTAFASDALPEREATRVATHLSHCARCQEELAAARRFSAALRTASPAVQSPSPYLWERLEAAIVAEAPAPRPSALRRLAPAGAVLASGAALAAVWLSAPAPPRRTEAPAPRALAPVASPKPVVQVAQDTRPPAVVAGLAVEKLKPGRPRSVPRVVRRKRQKQRLTLASEQAATLVIVGTQHVVEVAHTEALNRLVTETERSDSADTARRAEVLPGDATLIAQNTRSLFQ